MRAVPLRMRLDLERTVPAVPAPRGLAITPLDPHRAAEAHALLAAAYESGAGDIAPFAQWWPEILADSEYDPTLFFTALSDAGQIVGLALVWTSAFLKDLAVAPSHRGRGAGSALVLTAAREMRPRGHRSLDLKVRAGNETAIRLYRSIGFEPVGD